MAIENGQFAERIRRETLVRSNFERYFTPQLAQRIASSAGATRLGGDKRTVAVLFSDIRGFTPLSETMNPDDIAQLADRVLHRDGGLRVPPRRHARQVHRRRGHGAVGRADRRSDDADQAVRAAIDMMRELDKLNVRWVAEGRPELQIGIGLNYGEVFAGNIGSENAVSSSP